ncbi:MAG: hypothetical protein JO323_23910 [Acidobacteriia bacterium]|nr:hypothetical protein [Terriglobia bacterium]
MNPTNRDPGTGAVLGQKYAFATAALFLGIACYVNFLGLEKAALAILFAWLALRANPAPVLREHRGWAKAGLVLGILPWIMVPAVLIWKWNRVLDLLRMLQELKYRGGAW